MRCSASPGASSPSPRRPLGCAPEAAASDTGVTAVNGRSAGQASARLAQPDGQWPGDPPRPGLHALRPHRVAGEGLLRARDE